MASYDDVLEESCSPRNFQLVRKYHDKIKSEFIGAPLRLHPTREELLAEYTPCSDEIIPMLADREERDDKTIERLAETQLPTQLPPMTVRLEQQNDNSPRLESKSRSCCF